MTPTALAERIADCLATRARAKRLGIAMAAAGAVAGGLIALLTLGGVLPTLAGALAAAALGSLPPAVRRLHAGRDLAQLEADHPAVFPVAMERYRMVMATERASRYKLYC
ncbi:hypothetical protein [Rhodobacter sp. CZR27]|uniref:hypothetical protein n=1 Tax=Rhodobacter sp. CZR27 TaxID=2033869 RepID=UPI000BBF1ECE|nr:hypothetical protein [Rhodobacter sp. CZR27]